MPALVVIVGPIASGKSTVAAALGERFRASGRGAAVLDLDELVDTIGGFLGLPDERFRQAQIVFGQLVGAWLDQGFDVIAHGPFFHHDEDNALLHAVPDGITPRRVLLRTTFAVALERVTADPERLLASHPDVLKATYDRADELLQTMPPSEWTFDTTATEAQEIVTQLADAVLQHVIGSPWVEHRVRSSNRSLRGKPNGLGRLRGGRTPLSRDSL